ncbi:MAG: hypothetical protein AB4060_21835, partial [Crocosphaera sp.]
YDPVLEQNQPIQRKSDDSLSLWLEEGLTSLSSSWGVGSLSLILLSNLAIVGVQLWKLQENPLESPTATVNLEMAAPDLSIPKSLNIAKKSPDQFTLDGLSTVSNASISPQSPPQLQKPSPIPPAPTKKVVNVNQPLTLTNAILPPSLQPQTITPLQVPQPPKTAPLASTIPVAEIPRPLPSSIQPPPPAINQQLLSRDKQVRQMMQQQLTETSPPVTIQSPPTPVNNPTVSQDEQVRQSIKQQLTETSPAVTIQTPATPINNPTVAQDEQVRQVMQQQLKQTSPAVSPSPQPPTSPTVTIDNPPTPINNPSVSQEEQVRQSIKQQLNMEENNHSDIPLGFNHKTRLEMQNGINQVPSQLLPQQVKYMEQLQQREVLDSQVSPNMTIK